MDVYKFLWLFWQRQLIIADPVARINVWQLEGEPKHEDLLKFAINSKTILNSIVMITVDFSQVMQISLFLSFIHGLCLLQ